MSTTRYVLAEYASEQALYAAARRLRESGHGSLDIHSPYPLNGSDQALGLKRSKLPLVCLGGGLAGIATALLMQWWMNAIDYPINVGNRLLISYPAMIPVTFELGVLFASLSVFLGVLALFGATRLHHPLFEVEAFRSAAVDALWLSVEVKPEEAESVAEELRRLGAAQVAMAPEGA